MARIVPAGNEAKVLLVEGQDDKHVVLQICNRHPTAPDFYIQDRGGIEPLLDSVGSELIAHGRQALGVIADADDDATGRWTAIASRLAEENIQIPRNPVAEGLVIDINGRPRLGIWLMPDNLAAGEIEDFVAQMIPDGDPVWPLAQQYVDGIPPSARKFAAGKTLRAQLYSWLAVREDPRQMGLAIRARDLETDGALCRQFIDWLARLFG